MLRHDRGQRSLHVLDCRLHVARVGLLADAQLVQRNVEQSPDVLDAGGLVLDELRITVGCRDRRVLHAEIEHRRAVGVIRARIDVFPLAPDRVLDRNLCSVLQRDVLLVGEVCLGAENACEFCAVLIKADLVFLRLQSSFDGLRAAPQVGNALQPVHGKRLVMQHIGGPELAELARSGVCPDVPQAAVIIQKRLHVAGRDRQQLLRCAPAVAQDERVGIAVCDAARLHQLVIVERRQRFGRAAGQQPQRRVVGLPLARRAVHQVDGHFGDAVRDDLDAGVDRGQLHRAQRLAVVQAAARVPAQRAVQRQARCIGHAPRHAVKNHRPHLHTAPAASPRR